MIWTLAAALASPEIDPVEARLAVLQQERAQAALDATDYAPSPYETSADLPAILGIETHYQGWNDYYWFALVDGRVWYKPRFKRPTGQKDWVTDLPWKPFGPNGGLPYRLEGKESAAMAADTTYADGDRNGFVVDRVFETAEPDDWRSWIDVDGWTAAGTSLDGADWRFDPEFSQATEILALTADADELAVLSSDRQMFYRRKFANLFVSTEWMDGWGQSKDLPVRFPHHVTDAKGWRLGRITAAGVGYKEGPDGRIFEWGPAAVSMETMVWLSADGRVVYYLDSGTPPEVVHWIEPPFRGQYRGEAIDSSASTVMLLDRFGAVVTKIADFDLLGSTPTHPYCYFEECDDEPFYKPGDIRSGMSDIRLPAEDWALHEPVLPPQAWSDETWLTTRISIQQTGKGNAARELRIAGLQEGVAGTYYKGIDETAWGFRPAPEGDRAFWDLDADRLSQTDLVQYGDPIELRRLHQDEPVVDRDLTGAVELSGQDFPMTVSGFNLRTNRWDLTLEHTRADGERVQLPLELHLVQAWNPYMPPHYGLEDRWIQTYEGTLAFDRADLEQRLAGDDSRSAKAIRKLLDRAKNRKFVLIVNANEHGFEIRTKSRRRTGKLSGAALTSGSGPAGQQIDAFWALQDGHMDWAAKIEALARTSPAECTPEDIDWAARVRLLASDIDDVVRGVRQTKGQSRRFAEFTFVTSGLFYVTGLKTVDGMLDATRTARSDEVRPNELRFNVVTGITGRIPYLARNISRVHRHRLDAARSERKRTSDALKPLLRQAELDCD